VNREQFYVSISRGVSRHFFTDDTELLARASSDSRERKLPLNCKPT